VVAADHGGLSEIVVHGVTGLLFRPNDPVDLLTCLRALLSDRARLAAMGAAGRVRFEAEFSVPAYRDRLLEAWRRALP
jgi:glycosyltransferase involved in cell wall biosynthesis